LEKAAGLFRPVSVQGPKLAPASERRLPLAGARLLGPGLGPESESEQAWVRSLRLAALVMVSVLQWAEPASIFASLRLALE
jgi:hypothetical protein